MTDQLPILYSNDSCPYAFRARCALVHAGIEVEHREIRFDNKPPSMLEASAKGTVPTLVLADGSVIDESWDVMKWAVSKNDPKNWLDRTKTIPRSVNRLVHENDGGFSNYAYYYQYREDYPSRDSAEDRNKAEVFIRQLEVLLDNHRYLHIDKVTIVDMAIFPFVCNLADSDRSWFNESFPKVADWLIRLNKSKLVIEVSKTHSVWQF